MANILIIDDDEFYRDFLVTAVARQGHRAFELPNGQGAAEAVARNAIDLVITDIFMPHADGIEVLRELRDSHPGLPVVALTGELFDAKDLYGRAARRFGAARTLFKPIKPIDLIACIDDILATRPGFRGAGD